MDQCNVLFELKKMLPDIEVLDALLTSGFVWMSYKFEFLDNAMKYTMNTITMTDIK